jgi:hypothetical protein
MFVSTEIEISASPEECRKVVSKRTQLLDGTAELKIA